MEQKIMNSGVRKLATYLVSVAIFAGIPILSFSLLDGGQYFSSLARTLYVALVIVMNVPVVLLLPNEGRGSGQGVKLQVRHRISLLALQVLPLIIVVASPGSAATRFLLLPGQGIVSFVGLGVFVLGFFLMNWSVYVLGKQFSVDVTLQADHLLIRTGPFAVIRHPRYLGILVNFAGISLVFASIVGLIITGLLVIVLLWRIADEESLLSQQFGEDWTEYAKGTWKLMPFLY